MLVSQKQYLHYIFPYKDFIYVNLFTQTRFNKWYIVSYLTFGYNLNVKIVFQMEIRGCILLVQGLKKLFVLLENYFQISSVLHTFLSKFHSFYI